MLAKTKIQNGGFFKDGRQIKTDFQALHEDTVKIMMKGRKICTQVPYAFWIILYVYHINQKM